MARAADPRAGSLLEREFADATQDEIDTAVAAAAASAPLLAATPPAVLSAFLSATAERLDGLGDTVVTAADRETALGTARLGGELARTTGQLRMFARLVEGGEQLDAVIDLLDQPAAPARDIRRANRPVGPVVVFGASNFPLAFSVAGGDTASALAAGCPVVAKAHPAHPETSELVAREISAAVAEVGLPAGTFTLLYGAAPAVGAALVRADAVAAVGFTGSTAVGRALFDLAAARPSPIPVYAEMGSLNPVLVAPSAAAAGRLDAVADRLAASVVQGWGQFCTKPGVIMVPRERADGLYQALVERLAQAAPGHLLTGGIHAAFESRRARSAAVSGVTTWQGTGAESGFASPPTLARTDAATFMGDEALREEHFGPYTLIVEVDDVKQAGAVVGAVGGSLTATVQGDPDDPWIAEVLPILEAHAGRVIFNGVPTGVAVVPAMHHGGPYPSSTFSTHTSVGTAAIRRFLRPVAYQDAPDALLPAALRDANPLGIERVINGVRTRDPVRR